MRRPTALLALLLMSAATAISLASPAQAAAPITGRLVDAYAGSAPVAGMTVALRRVAAPGTPGTTVDTALTAADGTFSLDTGADPTYFVQVIAGQYQGGYVGGTPPAVQPSPSSGTAWPAGAAIGDVLAIPSFARGRVVDAVTRLPVRGVVVTARDILDRSIVLARAVTNANGKFVLTGISVEEIALRFNGAPVGYETGFGACGHGVVPTFGAACTWGTGALGTFRLDPS